MRIEKGHVSGPELNGQTSAADIGLGRLASTRKDYVGAVMSRRPAFTDPQRPRLVGVRPVDRSQTFKAGAHFLEKGAEPVTENDIGYLTSATMSPTLGHAIGLGFLKGGEARIGDVVRAWDGLRGTDIEVEVCASQFYDPEGARLRG
jgi:sarcosine oxidase subunit alpha